MLACFFVLLSTAVLAVRSDSESFKSFLVGNPKRLCLQRSREPSFRQPCSEATLGGDDSLAVPVQHFVLTVAWVHGQNLEASDEVGAGRCSLSLQRVVEAWMLSGKQALVYQPLGDGTAERLDPLKALVKLPFALESPVVVQQLVPLVHSSSAIYPQSVRSPPCS